MKAIQMNKKINVGAIKSGALVACLLAIVSCTDASKRAADAYPADNSGRNMNNEGQPTPVNQKENEADLKITQKIRQAVVDDNVLSVAAKNVKIITVNGLVTLRGPVDSEQEKQIVGTKAAGVAGVSKVENQLEVKSSK